MYLRFAAELNGEKTGKKLTVFGNDNLIQCQCLNDE